ncbi:MAG TPA: hypothetical protein VGQ83_24760 [Polyangia bacterium]|jgi:hypothetical protein
MSRKARHLLILVALGIFVWVPIACGGSGELRDASQAGGSFARIAVALVHRHDDPTAQMRLETEALFVRYRNAEADGIEALLGTSPAGGELRRGECRVVDRQARYTAAFNPDGPDAEVMLLDAGDVQVSLPGGPVTLAARRYPELVPFVSGVYYGEQEPPGDLDSALGGEVTVASAGGPEVGPFAVTTPTPLDLPLTQVTALPAGLDLRWPAGRDGEDVRIEVRGARGDGSRTLACAAPDDGGFMIAAAALAELGTRELSVSVARLRRQPFAAPAVGGGELLVIARDVAEVTLAELPRAAVRGASRPRTAR